MSDGSAGSGSGPSQPATVDEEREIVVKLAIDDHVALGELVNIHSRRAVARVNRSRWFLAGTLALAGMFFLIRGAPVMPSVFFATAVGFALFWPVYLRHAWRRSIARTVRESFGADDPSPSRLRLEAEGIREVGEGTESAWSFDAVIRIARMGPRVFVFVGPMMGLVIPLDRVEHGDAEAFVGELVRRSGREVERVG